MRNDLALQRRQRRQPWGCLERLLLVAFALCLAVGLGALYLLLAINRQPSSTFLDVPEKTMLVDKIVPQLAVRHLAGDNPDGLVQQSLQAGELATAQALLLFDNTIAPITYASRWLELAQKEIDQQELLRAAQATVMAQRVALLDPTLQPLERVQLLTQAAKLYASAEQTSAALLAISQSATVAAQTPDLLPAQRSQLFSALQPILATLPETDESRTLKLRVDDYTRNPFLAPSGIVISSTLFSLIAPPGTLATVLPALLTRQDAARALSERYILTDGRDVGPEQDALRDALLAENKLRLEGLAQALGAAPPAQQAELLLDQRQWLAKQLRAALRGYGFSLVAEWEVDVVGIQRELSTNTTELRKVFEQLASSQPTPPQQAMARLEATLWMIEQLELGLYPNGSAEELASQLQFAQAEVERLSGPLALPLVYSPSTEHLAYDFQQR